MSQLRMRWPKFWSFSFRISRSKEIPELISFRMDWLDLLAVKGTLKSPLRVPCIFIMDLAYHFEWNHQLGFMVRQVTGCAPLLGEVTSQAPLSDGAAGYALLLGGITD